MNARRLSLLLTLLSAAWQAAPACAEESSALQAPLDRATAGFFTQHCVRCHGEEKAEADLQLDRLDAQLARPETFSTWRNVLERIEAGEMPPEDQPRPAEGQQSAVVARITAALDEAVQRRSGEGRVVLRRLNRVEYENTVRDLFAVSVDVEDMLPEDAVSHGFDNIGEALNISPVQMERYLDAADAVIDAAIAPIKTAPREKSRHDLGDSLPSWFARSVLSRDNGVVLFRSSSSASHLGKWRAPVAGRYRFRISAYGYQSEVPVPMAVLVGNFNTASGSGRYVGYFDAPPREAGIIEIEARLENARDTIKVMPVDLPTAYLRPENIRDYPGPGLGIEWIEVDGPLPEAWPSESYRRVYGDVDPQRGTVADAERLLRDLLPRAFRRPATEQELRPYVALVSASLEAGQPFDESLRAGIKAVLCSPQFLYLKEQPGRLDDYALASRLSYFLWSSMPDEELLRLAAKGELQQPDVLHAQVERMLASPRAEAFTENFLGQWLRLREIDFTTPDAQLYPEFDELLQWSMVEETHAFFEHLLENDLSVLNFVDSDFAMLNQRLAEHYGVDGVEGVAMRKVKLKPEHHRGGVMTHASVLKVTANGTNTSPVLRGVWVLDRILGTPASPPPANVPAIEPDIRGATTIREQLAKHRQVSSCAACHAEIDPPGFALESYDVIGGWRESYRVVSDRPRQLETGPAARFLAKVRYDDGPAVECGDVLPGGRRFDDIAEFKRLLLADPDQIARNVCGKLMTYATGHPLKYGDAKQIDRLVAEAKKSNYGLRTIVHLVVADELFQSK